MAATSAASAVTHAPTPRFAHPSEAEFARILSFYGIRWQYEPRSFPLRTDGEALLEAFTPDFYLPDYDLYVELTTLRQSLATYKNRKVRLLRERYPSVNVRLLNRRDLLAFLAKFGVDPRGDASVPRLGPVLFDADSIQRRVTELGARIGADYAGREVVLVGVLRGVTCFMADLMRAIPLPVRMDLLALSAYQPDRESPRVLKPLEEDIRGKDVIVVEDVVDSGVSLHRLLRYLRRRGPASIEVCALLDKRARRLADVPLSYTGFTVNDEYVVGYGLDYNQQYRNLPFLATLAR